MPGANALPGLPRVFGKPEQPGIFFVDAAGFEQKVDVEHAAPVRLADQHDGNGGGFAGLDQRECAEQFIECAEAARQRDDGCGALHEVQLAQREVMKLKTQPRRQVGVGVLLARQGDVQTQGFSPCLERAAIGCLHAARAAAGHHREPWNPCRADHLAEFEADLVIARQRHAALGQTQRPGDGCVVRLLGSLMPGLFELASRRLRLAQPRAAEDHDGASDAVRLQRLLGFLIVELQSQAAVRVGMEKGHIAVGLDIRWMLHDGAQPGLRLCLFFDRFGTFPRQRLGTLRSMGRLRDAG